MSLSSRLYVLLNLLILTFNESFFFKKKTTLDFFSVIESPLPSLTGTEISIENFNAEYGPVWLNTEY